ncbi:MAG: inositol monophosphatase [Chloroflexi bacterium]|nr:inositol monophosphatase [Chloroflexota bacterium]
MKKPKLSDLEKLAKEAGSILRAGYNKTHQVEYKSTIDLVTEVDRQAEEFLLKSILDKFPEHHILAEEKGVVKGNNDHIWYIDPLDGTVNYAHNIPIFCVSIAYAYKRDLRLATVYDPMRDEIFSAERGKGAWLNGVPIRVSQVTTLERSLLVTGFPYDMWNTSNDNLANYGRFAKQTQGVRRLGAAALDLCYVGAGRFEGFWETSLQPWDVAAGGLIAEEAGAKVTDMEGEGDYVSYPVSILAAPSGLHKKMMEVLESKDD